MTMIPAPRTEKPDYGVDAPGLVRNFVLLGGLGILAGVMSLVWHESLPGWMIAVANLVLWLGLIVVLAGLVLFWGSKVGRVRFRERLVDELQLQGHERVLDVGCGRGLMLIGMAQRLTTGRAVGIDLWLTEDQSGNAITTTEENSRRAQVADKIELHTGDMRQLPFADASFEVIVSIWAIHKIYDAAGRREALAEIMRVLKPGGRVSLVDIRHTAEYEAVLRDLGLQEVRRHGPNYTLVIPTYVVWGHKSI